MPEIVTIPASIPKAGTTSKYRQLKVAAYCRVSTEHEEQINSFQMQCSYYTDYINKNKDWQFAGIYADEGLSATDVEKRTEFKRLIRACRNKKVDLESTEMIQDLINRIIEKYSDINGWKTTKRVTRIYYDSKGNEVDFRKNLFIKEKYTYEEFTTEVYEGPNANYWTATAANAIVPLYQLLVFAKLRPDGIWDGS